MKLIKIAYLLTMALLLNGCVIHDHDRHHHDRHDSRPHHHDSDHHKGHHH